MHTVGQILRKKGHDVWAINPDATVYEALELLAEKNIGALVVLEADELVGIFSERDYARKVILQGKTSRDTQISEVMTSRVNCVHPEQTTDECMALMTAKHIRHLPVLDEKDRLMGVISIGDVVKAIISDQEFVIEQLENYIKGVR